MTLADQVPDGWVVKRLSEVAHITAGGDVDPLTGSPVETDFHPHPVYANAIERSAIHSYSSVARNPAGAVTITARGTLGYAVYREKPFTAIGRLLVVWPNDRFDGRFLAQYLNARVSFAVESTGVPQLTGPQAGSYEVMLPTNLPEQLAIAAALSDADGVVAGLERVIAKKRLIKQGAMQDLLTARRRLPGFSGEWEEATISDVAHVDPEALGAGTPKDYAFRYISLEDVNQGVLSGWTDVAFGSAPSRARRILQKDDVLLGTVRPNLKSHMLFDRLGADWVGSTGFAVLRPRPEKCIPGYLFELIMSDVIGRQIDEVIAGSNYPAISNSDVRKLKVLLPSIDEQKAIASVLRDMDAEIQTLESRLAKARAVKEGMMQNLLTGRVRLV